MFRNFLPEFKVNDYLHLKLEKGKTNIYVKGKLFTQCKFLLLNFPFSNIEEIYEIESIDATEEKLDSSMEGSGFKRYRLTPEIEFWAHCSNLQAWYENDYDTRLLHRNLAFPLLKALSRAGDPLAKEMFKKEIVMRLESGCPSVVSYLLTEEYLKYLTREEINRIFENPKIKESLSDYPINPSTIPSWLYSKIRKLRPRTNLEPTYDVAYKIIVFSNIGDLKTQLIQRFLTNLFKSDSKMTIGVDFEVKTIVVDKRRVKLQLWDFGGEERYRFLLHTYVRGANGALFTYDITKYNTLAHIDDWLIEIKKELREDTVFPIMMVGIVPGLDEERQVLLEDAIKIAQSRDLDGFAECCPRTGENVEETFEALTRIMLARSGFDITVEYLD